MREWKRKEPPPLQAEQLTEENLMELLEWCGGVVLNDGSKVGIYIETPIGPKRAWFTDYLINENGMFRVEHADRFEDQFEPNQTP